MGGFRIYVKFSPQKPDWKSDLALLPDEGLAMRLTRLRLRTLMIGVAVLAPVFAASAWLYQVATALEDLYGPRGQLALRQQIGNEISVGTDDLERSRYAEAETRYRSALRLDEELRSTTARHGWPMDNQFSAIAVGLADALVGQHRHSEAVQALQYGAILVRQMGQADIAKDLTARADAIRADMVRLAR